VRHLRALDVVLIAAFSTGAIAFTVHAYSGGSGAAVSIISSGVEWIYGIDTDTRVAIAGPLGETIVEIADGEARIVDSPCRDKVCISMGSLVHVGDWSACLPNGVLVRILGEHGDVDAISF
jgi:hypothetical protein